MIYVPCALDDFEFEDITYKIKEIGFYSGAVKRNCPPVRTKGFINKIVVKSGKLKVAPNEIIS